MYSIKKVAELTGIPTVTIRAWENRYHVVSPSRSEGGHRLYTEDHVQLLKWLKHKTEFENYKISDAVRLWEEQHGDPSMIDDPYHNQYSDMIYTLFNHLTQFNTQEANQTINLAFSLFDYEVVVHRIFLPLLKRVGEGWNNGTVSIAQEHFISELIMQRCHELIRTLPIDDSLPKAIAFTPEDEPHQIGLLTFTLFLRKQGMEVLYLGARTPLNQISPILESHSIKLLAMSMSYPDSLQLENLTTELKPLINNHADLEIAIGGPGVTIPDLKITSDRLHDLNQKSWDTWFQQTIKKSDATV